MGVYMEENNDEQWIERGLADIEMYLSTDGLQEYERSISIISHQTVSLLQENGVDIYIDPAQTIFDQIDELSNSIGSLERQKRSAIILSELNVHPSKTQGWQTIGNINRQKESLEYKKQLLGIVLRLSEASFNRDQTALTNTFAEIVVSRELQQDDRLEFLKITHQLVNENSLELSMIDVFHRIRDRIDEEEELRDIKHYFDRSGWYVLGRIARIVDDTGENVMAHEDWDLFVEKIIERGIYRFISATYFDEIEDLIYGLAVNIGIPQEKVNELLQEIAE